MTGVQTCALPIFSDAAEAFAKMWEEVFSSPDIWPGRKSVPPKKYGMSLLKKRPYQAFSAYQYRPIPPLETDLTSGVPIENEAGYF